MLEQLNYVIILDLGLCNGMISVQNMYQVLAIIKGQGYIHKIYLYILCKLEIKFYQNSKQPK